MIPLVRERLMNRCRHLSTIIAVLLLPCWAQPARAREASARYPGVETNEALRSWLVLAPIPISTDAKEAPAEPAQRAAFGRDFLAAAGGEGAAAPRAGEKVAIDGKEYEWRLVTSESDTVSFDSGTGPVPFAVAYAFAEVGIPAARKALVGLGSDDAVKVWVNGREVHARWIARGVEQDADVVPVSFAQGANRILIKVQNIEGDWGFALRLLGGQVLQDRLVDAARSGETAQIEAILGGGAPVDGPDGRGLTAYQSAKLHGRRRAMDLLLSKGASATLKAPAPGLIVDRTFKTIVKEGYPGATVLVAQDGKVLLRKGYGSACLEHRVAATPTTRYRIGSVTKQFTAAAVLRLQEAGKLSVEDRLSKFFPDYPRGDEVTVRHLLTHTSGIHSYTSKPDFVSTVTVPTAPEALIRSFKDDPFDFEPGRKYLYSNSGYFLLGAIVEKVSGLTYADYLRRTFFEPLGMKQTGVHDSRDVIVDEACGYAWENGRVRKALNWDMSRAGGAGSLYSTIDDLYLWNEALFSGKVVPDASFKEATTPALIGDEKGPKEEGYGYGLAIGSLRGQRLVGHDGGLQGFQSSLIRVPDRRLTVVVLSNSAPNVPGLSPGPLAHEILELYLGESMPDRVEPTADASVSPASFDDYSGLYDYGGAILTVTREGDRLVAQLTGQPSFEIFPKGKDTFFWKAVEAEVTFVRDGSGKVVKAVHRQGGQTLDAERFELPVAIHVDPQRWDDYVGKYDYGQGRLMAITREDARLFAQLPGQPKLEIFPKAEAEFFWKAVRAEVAFVRDTAGKVVKAVHRQGGGTLEAPKVE
jgi:CubicO group peptidase (beta-lactamase class C family)